MPTDQLQVSQVAYDVPTKNYGLCIAVFDLTRNRLKVWATEPVEKMLIDKPLGELTATAGNAVLQVEQAMRNPNPALF